MEKQNIVYIGLGSNLGDRKKNIHQAIEMLDGLDNIKVVANSKPVEYAPLGGINQPDFFNCVAQTKTTLVPKALHNELIKIEDVLGRERKGKWSPRTIDLDILLFGREIINLVELTVPHQQMHLRSFVLEPLSELDPNLIHPVLSETVQELASRLNGNDFILQPELPQLVSIAGMIGVGKTTLAKALINQFGCPLILEPYDTNPFMPDVYAGRVELALDSQLYFLTKRTEQLNIRNLIKGQLVISDYIFDKELIYANILLNPEQLKLYQAIYKPLTEYLAKPIVVFYIKDSPENCLKRIRKRNRPYEQGIDINFLKRLNDDYEKLFSNWKISPVIRIHAQELDYESRKYINHLADQLKYYTTI